MLVHRPSALAAGHSTAYSMAPNTAEHPNMQSGNATISTSSVMMNGATSSTPHLAFVRMLLQQLVRPALTTVSRVPVVRRPGSDFSGGKESAGPIPRPERDVRVETRLDIGKRATGKLMC